MGCWQCWREPRARNARPLGAWLGRAGARLAVVGRELTPASTLSAALAGAGCEASAYAAGLSAAAVRAALDRIHAQQGRPHLLVTCPGPPAVAPSAELPEAEFRRALEETTLHAFLWCQAVGGDMVAASHASQEEGSMRDGPADGSAHNGAHRCIINVTGLSGLGGWPGWLADSVALGGVHNLTHTLAAEWSRYGLRVNCLVPGVTEEMVPYLLKTPEAADREAVLRRIPAGRLATADDLGKALIYLVRPSASFISGEMLRVDGAWDVWGRYYAVDPAARR